MFLFRLRIYPGVELLGHTITVFNHFRNCQTVFQSGCATLYSHQQCVRVSRFPHLANVYTTEYEVVSLCDFDVHFSNDVEHLFVDLFTICISSLEKCLSGSVID